MVTFIADVMSFTVLFHGGVTFVVVTMPVSVLGTSELRLGVTVVRSVFPGEAIVTS